MYIAFFIGPCQGLEKVVRLLGNPTHCELVFSDGTWVTSSPRDGGVRLKKIDYNPEHWVFYKIKATKKSESKMRKFVEREQKKSYDWIGCLLSWVSFYTDLVSVQEREKWFCSEFCIEILNKGELLNMNPFCPPQKFYKKISEFGFTRIYDLI